MDTSLNLSTTENSTLNTIRTWISNSKIHKELFARLNDIQNARKERETTKKELDYVKSLLVAKGNVPADEASKGVLAEYKYSM